MDDEKEILETEKKQDVAKNRKPLLPHRYPDGELFICEILDATFKGDQASMEHPIFSLSTKPDLKVRRYERGSDYIEIIPSVLGIATMHDRDILIYCISQLVKAANRQGRVYSRIRIKALDFLVATNRQTTGQAYDSLKISLERLAGTRISTNIATGGKIIFKNFGLIESSEIIRETKDGRMQEIEIVLSEWVLNAIKAQEVLTMNRNYFRLRKPLERRLYEITRKHCGHQEQWGITLDSLKKKCGSLSTTKEFRRMILSIIAQDQNHNYFPDYAISMEHDIVVFRLRDKKPYINKKDNYLSKNFNSQVIKKARELAPDCDVNYLYEEWLFSCRKINQNKPLNPEKSFLLFCRNYNKKHGK